MNTISAYRYHGLPGTPASRGSPGCRYRGPGRRKDTGHPGPWDLGLGSAVRKGPLP